MAPISFTQLSTGSLSGHFCGIGADGLAYCWGNNTHGQLGNGSTTDSSVPVAVDTTGALSGQTIKQIATGHVHTCALAADDQAYCWGYNAFGQLGNNSATASPVPVAVNTDGALSGQPLKQIAAGYLHTCALAADDRAYCWGDNDSGKLGNNSTADSTVPVAVVTSGALSGQTLKQIVAGSYHTCALAADDRAYCWGGNNHGQLGNNSTHTPSPVPVAVDTAGALSGQTLKQIATNDRHTCALAADDQAYCWGRNDYGQLGNNSTAASSPVPVAVVTTGALSGQPLQQIAAGYLHTCTLAADDQAYCWGLNSTGQLGNGSTTDSSVPVAVDTTGALSGQALQQIAAGDYHTCALAADGRATCWGYNAFGQLGNDSTADSTVPVPVSSVKLTPTVTVGGVAATLVVVADDGTLTFTAPAMPVGTYALTISYTNGATFTLPNALTYGRSGATAIPALHPIMLGLLSLVLGFAAWGFAGPRRRS
ncbi:MAG: hypothetical protein LBE75_06555 [Burkholderiales bacterium]|nr:hypothetical protein [Burkholderiales bacterium]